VHTKFGKRRADKCHIYTDFKKAFDKVPQQLLLQKLKLYKVDPSIINGIKDFLCFRKQRVRLNGFFSKLTEVISGIPQGIIIGPILFIIYINDLPDIFKSRLKTSVFYCFLLTILPTCFASASVAA